MEFKHFQKSINLEKSLSNDLVIKRKLKRNKKTGESKFFYEVIGKLDFTYEFSSLHDYIFMEKEEDDISYNINTLKNHLINLDQYFYDEKENNFSENKGKINIFITIINSKFFRRGSRKKFKLNAE